MAKHIVSEKEEKRMKLYNQGLSDKDIARATGESVVAIRYWRYKHNLTSNRRKKINIDKEFTPEQCKLVRQFFKYLLAAKKLNPSLDVGRFMEGYKKVM